MDPVTLMAAAIAAGAAAGLTDTSKQAVIDAYGSVRELITRRYHSVDLTGVEAQPELEAQHAELAQELQHAGAGDDEELLHRLRRLVQLIDDDHSRDAAHTAPPPQVTAVKFLRSKLGEAEIRDSTSAGALLEAQDLTVDGKLSIVGVHTGLHEPPHPPPAPR
ncbi:hypothetical protein [Nocardia nepalensis]|uniref:hypothetical protein n=1 Tax=Nocardia nepalensis TaxID=3375448 RepID=UPI003B66B0B0